VRQCSGEGFARNPLRRVGIDDRRRTRPVGRRLTTGVPRRDIAEAVSAAHEHALPGQIVLFAPGGTSFDAFADYEERGLVFKRLVKELV